MAFDKITAEDTNGKGVVGLPDTPQLDTTSMQKKFDELAVDVIIPKFNKLVDDMSGNGAAGSTGAKVPEGLVSEQNIQAVLQALHDDTQTRQPKESGKGLSTNDYTNEEKNTVQENTNSRHTHENKSVLDLITSSVKSGYDRVVTMLSSVKRVATEVEASDESIPTGNAIVNFVQDMGGGDMSTSKYDPDKDGKVLKAEQADDTSLFAGQPPAYYAKADMVTKKYDANAAYTKGQTCIQSDKIWRAKDDINTPESWTEDHWEETSLEQIRAEMESELSALNASNTFMIVGIDISGTTVSAETSTDALEKNIQRQGYIPLCISGIQLLATPGILIQSCYLSNNQTTLTYTLRNTGGSSATLGNANIFILYKKL